MDIEPSAILPRRPNFGSKKAIFGPKKIYVKLCADSKTCSLIQPFHVISLFLAIFKPNFTIFGKKWDFKQKGFFGNFDKTNYR